MSNSYVVGADATNVNYLTAMQRANFVNAVSDASHLLRRSEFKRTDITLAITFAYAPLKILAWCIVV